MKKKCFNEEKQLFLKDLHEAFAWQEKKINPNYHHRVSVAQEVRVMINTSFQSLGNTEDPLQGNKSRGKRNTSAKLLH